MTIDPYNGIPEDENFFAVTARLRRRIAMVSTVCNDLDHVGLTKPADALHQACVDLEMIHAWLEKYQHNVSVARCKDAQQTTHMVFDAVMAGYKLGGGNET